MKLYISGRSTSDATIRTSQQEGVSSTRIRLIRQTESSIRKPTRVFLQLKYLHGKEKLLIKFQEL